MADIHLYLKFNNTKEALVYYENVLGATKIQRMPVSEEQAYHLDSQLKMHSQFCILGTTVMAAETFKRRS